MANRFWSGSPQENFDSLDLLLDDLFGGADLRIRSGADSVTFSSSATSGTRTVAHGLGRVPVFVGVFSGAFVIPVSYYVQSVDSVHFTYLAKTTNLATSSGAQATYWLALG